MELVFRYPLSLLPVLVFLVALIFLDSYKLVRLRTVVAMIATGVVAAGAAYFINVRLIGSDGFVETRYVVPVVEEFLKAAFIVYLLRAKKIGFMVDAAILGFAVGAGFALCENIYYLESLRTTNLFVWLTRGFGTAIMHGGTTAIVAIMSKNLMDTRNSGTIVLTLPGFAAAVLIHAFFNQLFLHPLLNTAVIAIALPVLMGAIYQRSERSTRKWLGVGFDADVGTLNMIVAGNISDSPIGAYLRSIKDRFTPEVVVDIFCYLRLYLELSVKAKGVLLMRETGFDMPPDPEIRAKFRELSYLEKSIGKTGKIALSPFIRSSSTDLWQLHMLEK